MPVLGFTYFDLTDLEQETYVVYVFRYEELMVSSSRALGAKGIFSVTLSLLVRAS